MGQVKGNGLLVRQRLDVRQEADMVVLMINNAEVKFHYNVAFQLVGKMRQAAGMAKAFVGDTSRDVLVNAALSDKTVDDAIAQRRRDATIIDPRKRTMNMGMGLGMKASLTSGK